MLASCFLHTPITSFLNACLFIAYLFIACLCHLLVGPTYVACLSFIISNFFASLAYCLLPTYVT
jgi:hypothetical protein